MSELERQFTGAQEREPSPSDFHLGALTPDVTIPEVFMPSYNLTIEDQKKIPDCGANAGVYLKEILHDGSRGSVEYVWNKIKLIDGFPPADGTTMDAIFKVMKDIGMCLFTLLPTDSTQTLTQFTNPAKLTKDMDIDAATRKIGPYAFTFNPSWQELKTAIYTHKAVVMLLRVGSEWWTRPDGVSSWQEKDILPLRSNVPRSSGHFVVAYAYDKDNIYFVNEWSDQWGRKGYGYFGIDYMNRCVEIGTSVDPSAYIFTKTLKIGMSGTEVGMLQLKLRDLGFFKGSITSYFGTITRQAVMDFQTAHNLKADGVDGPFTNAELNKVV